MKWTFIPLECFSYPNQRSVNLHVHVTMVFNSHQFASLCQLGTKFNCMLNLNTCKDIGYNFLLKEYTGIYLIKIKISSDLESQNDKPESRLI